MSKKQLSVLIAGLFAASSSLAQSTDPFLSTGQVEAGGIYSNASGRDQSKFMEYQDLNSGIMGRNQTSWITAYGENFGRDDQYMNIRGGMYDVFKAQAYLNWIPHNFLFNGITPFAGTGSGTLTANFPAPNLGTWNTIDLGYQRKNIGGYIEWQQASPWYVRFDGSQLKMDGTKPGAGANGTSPGNGFVDLPMPINYTTNNAAFEGGYTTKTFTFTASYLVSNFFNDTNVLTWTNPYFGNGTDTTYLPFDNQYQRFAANAVWRALPWNSTLALRYTYDKTTDDGPINPFALNTAGSSVPTNFAPDTQTFNGNQKRQTFTAGWSATPVTNLDTKVYFNWQKMNNDSTEVTFCPSNASSCGGIFENVLYDYQKTNVGVDAYYRIDRANRIGAGYDYFHQTQNREDYDEENTNTIWVEWKNSTWDTLNFRLKYSYLHRDANFLLGNAGANANDPAYLERFVGRFDLADLTQNRVKFTTDWAPADNWGVAGEFIYKKNQYKDYTIGRLEDRRWEIYGNVTYGTPS